MSRLGPERCDRILVPSRRRLEQLHRLDADPLLYRERQRPGPRNGLERRRSRGLAVDRRRGRRNDPGCQSGGRKRHLRYGAELARIQRFPDRGRNRRSRQCDGRVAEHRRRNRSWPPTITAGSYGSEVDILGEQRGGRDQPAGGDGRLISGTGDTLVSWEATNGTNTVVHTARSLAATPTTFNALATNASAAQVRTPGSDGPNGEPPSSGRTAPTRSALTTCPHRAPPPSRQLSRAQTSRPTRPTPHDPVLPRSSASVSGMLHSTHEHHLTPHRPRRLQLATPALPRATPLPALSSDPNGT